MLILYGIFLIILSVYSYSLIDLNLTLISHPLWNKFRDWIIQLGYFHRDISWAVYLALVIIAFGFHFYFIKNHKRFSPINLSLTIGLILLFSYPFLSHDLFNYLFDAKIFTFYHQNPYLMKALDFPNDPWIRFMHWTHRTYPYGPTFLLLTIIPSFFSFGKFILSFLFYKILIVGFYIFTSIILNKTNRKWAMIFVTSPLVLVEGLVNGHNDMIALMMGLIGIIYFNRGKSIISMILFLISGGIKYMTLPLIGLTKKSWTNKPILFILLGILVYMGVKMEIQPWYYLTLLIFIPFYEDVFIKINIFIAGLLLSYYPYIRMGGWDSQDKILLKHQIIAIALAINLFYLFFEKIVLNKMKFSSPRGVFKTKD